MRALRPRAEACNAFDDDCDGVADNGQLCGPNATCFEAQCYEDDEPLPASDGGTGRDPPPSGCQSAPALGAWLLGVALARVRQRRMRRA